MNLEWNEQFSVGIDRLDQHHKRILCLLKTLTTKPAGDIDAEATSEIMTELILYADQHLDYEERYMQEHRYPDYTPHCREHINYKQTVANLSLDIVNKNPQAMQKLLSFLEEWWTSHILKTDMKYKDFFAAINAG